MAVQWRFRCYVSRRGVDEIRAAYDGFSKRVQARFLGRVRTLAMLPEDEWHKGFIKKLSGPCEGLREIRFEADNVQHRPLGFKSPAQEFTILLWAQEKSSRFVPPNACSIALTRTLEIDKDGSRAHALWLALE